jgi:hypothetical protein
MKISFQPSIIAICLLAASAASANQYVYPSRGQDSAQQSRDEADCSAWAIQQTGYDPTRNVSAPVAPQGVSPLTSVAAPGLGGTAGTAAAALGAFSGGGAPTSALGLLGGGGSPEAAAVGLLSGALSHQQTQPQAQTQVAQNTGQAQFEQARAACLSGRGYSVQ